MSMGSNIIAYTCLMTRRIQRVVSSKTVIVLLMWIINANGKDRLLLRHAIHKHFHVSFDHEDKTMLLFSRQYGYHTSWYLSRWCHLAALTETKVTRQFSTTLVTVKTQCCKKNGHNIKKQFYTSSSSSSLGSRCVPWLGEGLSMPFPS